MRIFLVFLLALAPALPLRAGISVEGGLTREYSLSPGEEVSGRLLLANRSEEPVSVAVYPRDYHFRAGEGSSYPEPGTLERSNAGWLSAAPGRLIVEAGGTGTVYYSLAAPEDEDLSGVYWSMLMLEEEPSAVPAFGDRDGPVSVGVSAAARHGVQFIARMGGGKARIDFPSRELVRGPRGPVLLLDAENTGTGMARVRVRAEVYDPAGKLSAAAERPRRRLYPGTSARFRLPLGEKIPPGRHTAVVIAETGETAFGARYTLDIPGADAE